MSYEFEDYRPKKPKPTWLEWTPNSPRRYLLIQLALNFLIPGFMGVALTTIGLLCNVILIDWLLYIRDSSRA